GPQGPSSQWLQELPLRLHLVHQEGITGFTYKPGDISAEKARDYLTVLAADLLDPTSFDLLPLEALVPCADFRRAYQTVDEIRDFPQRLENFLEEEREKEGFSTYRRSPLLDLANAKVPLDALDKVRRRFRILDRGPKRNRQRSEQKRTNPRTAKK